MQAFCWAGAKIEMFFNADRSISSNHFQKLTQHSLYLVNARTLHYLNKELQSSAILWCQCTYELINEAYYSQSPLFVLPQCMLSAYILTKNAQSTVYSTSLYSTSKPFSTHNPFTLHLHWLLSHKLQIIQSYSAHILLFIKSYSPTIVPGDMYESPILKCIQVKRVVKSCLMPTSAMSQLPLQITVALNSCYYASLSPYIKSALPSTLESLPSGNLASKSSSILLLWSSLKATYLTRLSVKPPDVFLLDSVPISI